MSALTAADQDRTTTRSATTRRGADPSVRRPVWKHGVAASAIAAVATTSVAAAASAAGVPFSDGTGASVPIAAFAQLTLVFSLIGVALAGLFARKARRPRSAFVRTTLALTALSLIPDATFGFDAASAVTLMGLHLLAAAIVIPTVARRLA